ncbi:nucleotide disphospho-sugar-binding domain-containing protein [Amycolatopsis sp. NPDC003676]
MRILFVTWNSTAHLPAMLPLAWAFSAAGHEIAVAAPPEDAERARGWGLPAVAVGAQPANGGPPSGSMPAPWPRGWQRDPALLDDTGRAFLAGLARKQLGIAAAMLPDLLAYATPFAPDVVIYDAASLAGEVAATRLGVPAIAHSWGRVAPVRLHRDADGAPLPAYADLFARFDAPVPDHAPPEFDPCPAALRAPGDPAADLRPIRAVPRLPPRPYGRAPRVAVLPDGHHDPLAQLDLDVAVAHADGLALPACDVLVHRGSGPATLAAAASGVPQVVVPMRPEQWTAAERVEAAGAGRLSARIPDAATINSVLGDAALREGAEALAAAVRTAPAPAEIVARIEQGSFALQHTTSGISA